MGDPPAVNLILYRHVLCPREPRYSHLGATYRVQAEFNFEFHLVREKPPTLVGVQFTTWLLSYVFIALWSLLLIVPGIIKSLSYSQAEFIVKDMTDAGQEVAATEAINKSRELMNGHKWEYFLLELSFIGWDLLGGLSLGIGFLWILPYIKATEAEYYRKLTGDQLKTELVNKDTQKIAKTTSFGN